MQRITSLAACRELGGGLAAFSSGVCAWKRAPTWDRKRAVHRQWTGGACARPARPLCRRRLAFAGPRHRPYSSLPGAGGPPRGQHDISVVGIPDPLTWFRCKVIMYLIKLYFELDLSTAEFETGVKQALVHISSLMSSGRYHRLVGMVSKEMRVYVEEKCVSLTRAQRLQLSVTMDDIVFVLPEDISVVFDEHGRKFCFLAMRFWLLSAHEGPDDPEATKIFEVASSEDGGPRKKIVTAVYEFHSELTRGGSPDWTVTTVWHWPWKAAE